MKPCQPARSSTFTLRESGEAWIEAPDNWFVVFVWLGAPSKNERPRFWIARNSEGGVLCREHSAHATNNLERQFLPKHLPTEWENNRNAFDVPPLLSS